MNKKHYKRSIVYVFCQIQDFKRGDEIVVKSDKNLVKDLQEDHGGWNESMISVSLFIVSMFIYSFICLFVCLLPLI